MAMIAWNMHSTSNPDAASAAVAPTACSPAISSANELANPVIAAMMPAMIGCATDVRGAGPGHGVVGRGCHEDSQPRVGPARAAVANRGRLAQSELARALHQSQCRLARGILQHRLDRAALAGVLRFERGIECGDRGRILSRARRRPR